MLRLGRSKLKLKLLLVDSPCLRTATIFPSNSILHRLLSTFRPSFSYSPDTTNPAAKLLLTLRSHYPPDQALEPSSSKNISPLGSVSPPIPIPDSTRQFFREYGLTEEQITSVFSRDPLLLRANVDTHIKPSVKQLEEMGFSPSDISRVILLSPISLRLGDIRKNVNFWLSILGSVENLLKALRRNMFLLTCNVDGLVEPNISFLKESCSLSSSHICQLLISKPSVIISYPKQLKEVVKRADSLGIPRGTRCFRDALGILFRTDRNSVNYKMELLKSLGWSETEVRSIIAKHPYLFAISGTNIRRTVGFLRKEFGLSLQDIARDPYLIQLSMEKRLIPRCNVVKTLRKRGLIRGSFGFKSVAFMSEKMFREKFVMPHKDAIPGFCEKYDAACAGKQQ